MSAEMIIKPSLDVYLLSTSSSSSLLVFFPFPSPPTFISLLSTSSTFLISFFPFSLHPTLISLLSIDTFGNFQSPIMPPRCRGLLSRAGGRGRPRGRPRGSRNVNNPNPRIENCGNSPEIVYNSIEVSEDAPRAATPIHDAITAQPQESTTPCRDSITVQLSDEEVPSPVCAKPPPRIVSIPKHPFSG